MQDAKIQHCYICKLLLTVRTCKLRKELFMPWCSTSDPAVTFLIFTQPAPQGCSSFSKSLKHDQCNYGQLRATRTMYINHATIKQTMQLKLLENVTMDIAWKDRCNVLHILQSVLTSAGRHFYNVEAPSWCKVQSNETWYFGQLYQTVICVGVKDIALSYSKQTSLHCHIYTVSAL